MRLKTPRRAERWHSIYLVRRLLKISFEPSHLTVHEVVAWSGSITRLRNGDAPLTIIAISTASSCKPKVGWVVEVIGFEWEAENEQAPTSPQPQECKSDNAFTHFELRGAIRRHPRAGFGPIQIDRHDRTLDARRGVRRSPANLAERTGQPVSGARSKRVWGLNSTGDASATGVQGHDDFRVFQIFFFNRPKECE